MRELCIACAVLMTATGLALSGCDRNEPAPSEQEGTRIEIHGGGSDRGGGGSIDIRTNGSSRERETKHETDQEVEEKRTIVHPDGSKTKIEIEREKD